MGVYLKYEDFFKKNVIKNFENADIQYGVVYAYSLLGMTIFARAVIYKEA